MKFTGIGNQYLFIKPGKEFTPKNSNIANLKFLMEFGDFFSISGSAGPNRYLLQTFVAFINQKTESLCANILS